MVAKGKSGGKGGSKSGKGLLANINQGKSTRGKGTGANKVK